MQVGKADISHCMQLGVIINWKNYIQAFINVLHATWNLYNADEWKTRNAYDATVNISEVIK